MNKLLRSFFALSALVALTGLIIGASVAATSGATFDAGWKNLLNYFTYFTAMSNVLVVITCATLALSSKERGPWFRALRLDGLICIIVTAVVYHGILAADDHPKGWGVISNFLVHSLSPLLVVVGWVVFGPRGLTNAAVVKRALVIPIGWLVFTFIRGAISDYYPYDFLNANIHGYAEALITVAVITAMFIALAALSVPVDRLLNRQRD